MLNNNQVKVRNILNGSRVIPMSESIIAVAMAYCAPLPLLAGVRSDDIFYIHNVSTKVLAILDSINEEMVIDIFLASEMCRDVWFHRINAITNPLVTSPAAISGWTTDCNDAYCAIKELMLAEFPQLP
jgi:hypothetical protein